jgi:ADP-dependent NAD(P)H-hydrate dehydratase
MEQLLGKISRESGSHKGENGKVGVIGGSRDFSGAPALNAYGALRSGCDLVKILTSAEIRDVLRGYSENFIVESYSSGYFGEEAASKAEDLSEWADAIVIGSGLSQPDELALKEFVEVSETPMVVDADAIEPLMNSDFSKAVFTPHEGEAEAIREEFGSIENFVSETEAVVVLKGEKDEIFTPAGRFENETGHETMTVGGTGDVLAGVIASLVSQGLGTEEAARLGAWINGKAGELAAEELGNGALATDIVEKIQEVISD